MGACEGPSARMVFPFTGLMHRVRLAGFFEAVQADIPLSVFLAEFP